MRCRYCDNIFSNPIGGELNVHNRILFETEHFVAVPTVGSLVEGWLLIVTKEHHICMASIDRYLLDELDRFKVEVSCAVEACYGPVAIFEHGPSKPSQAVGCGVDHAHLHIVPTVCDLIAGLRGVFNSDLRWQAITGTPDAAAPHSLGLEYLYVEQPVGNASLATNCGFESQLFRKVIARHIGEPERYDWKLYDGLENVRRTWEKLTTSTYRNTRSLPGLLPI